VANPPQAEGPATLTEPQDAGNPGDPDRGHAWPWHRLGPRWDHPAGNL